jgi:lipopolysaccharide/colanic/teichoic acid biosynthesis glycosyltransferase
VSDAERGPSGAAIPGAPPGPGTFYARAGKRALDLLASAGVFLAFGWLMALIALLIKLEDGGPVFYRQERIGMGGRPFFLTKFRSMVVGAEHRGAGILVERNDARITRTGKVIRKLSLDELAQIFDVVRGSMSIVGPRPGLRYQAELYDTEQIRRLSVRPGITGWAQINGRNAIRWPERIRLDLEYIRRMSLPLDVFICLRTIPSLLSGSDQIADADYWRLRRSEIEASRDAIERARAGRGVPAMPEEAP